MTGIHRLGQNSLLSRVKMMLNPAVIREKTQRLEAIQGGLGLHQCVFRTPNDPNPACDHHRTVFGRSGSPMCAAVGGGSGPGGEERDEEERRVERL